MKKSQRLWVIDQLNTYGEVTRNQALAHSVTRLGAIMQLLKTSHPHTGMERGGDYVYVLNHKVEPRKVKPIYVTLNGKRMSVQDL